MMYRLAFNASTALRTMIWLCLPGYEVWAHSFPFSEVCDIFLGRLKNYPITFFYRYDYSLISPPEIISPSFKPSVWTTLLNSKFLWRETADDKYFQEICTLHVAYSGQFTWKTSLCWEIGKKESKSIYQIFFIHPKSKYCFIVSSLGLLYKDSNSI